MSKIRWLIIVCILGVTGVACQLGNYLPMGSQQNGQKEQTGQESSVATSPAIKPTKGPSNPKITYTPTPIPSTPIGIRQGLSSLNSYRQSMIIKINGPTAQDINEYTLLFEYGSDANKHIHIENTRSSADDPEVNTSISEQYRIGDTECDFSPDDEETKIQTIDPMQNEMIDVLFRMMDFTPVINNPELVGEEMINGIKTNHFKFTVSGLGTDSGATVLQNKGDYWLAQDGQYIVKYDAILETSDGPTGDPNTKLDHFEFHLDLTDVNQSFTIDLPARCQQ